MHSIGRKELIMMDNQNLELINLQEENAWYTTKVRSFYKPMDLCHDEKHFDEVYNEAMRLGFWSVATDIISMHELRLLLAAAAFHDVGRCRGDKLHDQYSCEIIDEHHPISKILFDKFTPEEIEVIKETITAHRRRHEAKTEIARILKDADKISRTNRKRALYRFIGFNYTHIYFERYGHDSTEIPSPEDQDGIREEIIERFTDYYNKSKDGKGKYNMSIHNSTAAIKIYNNNSEGFVEPPSEEEMDETFPIIMHDLCSKLHQVKAYIIYN